MGQQQLLLLVIGVIIVGIAVLAAYPAFEKGQRQDEADGLLDRGLSIATYAVQWKTQNEVFGGGNGSYERIEARGLQTLSMDSTTIRGRFAITDATPNTIQVTGVSDRYPEIGIRVFVSQYAVDSSRVSFSGDFSL